MKLYDRIFPPKKYQLPNGKVVEEKFTRLPLILLVILLTMIWTVWGVVEKGYYIPEIASQFFVMGLVAGIIGVAFHLNDMKLNDIPKAFDRGAADLLGAAMCVGMAQGIIIILGGTSATDGTVLNTIFTESVRDEEFPAGDLCMADVHFPVRIQFLCGIRLRAGSPDHAGDGAAGGSGRCGAAGGRGGLPAGRCVYQLYRAHLRMSFRRFGSCKAGLGEMG